MAVREVLLYPNPALKQVASEVVDMADAAEVVADLLDTMRASSFTTGIAATQIGSMLRVVAVDVTGHRKTTTCHGEFVLINPVVESSSGAEVAREGCLSLPSLTANVRRATSIEVSGLAADGSDLTISTDGFEARCLLHEIDHLDGILFLDRVDSLKTDVFRRKRST